MTDYPYPDALNQPLQDALLALTKAAKELEERALVHALNASAEGDDDEAESATLAHKHAAAAHSSGREALGLYHDLGRLIAQRAREAERRLADANEAMLHLLKKMEQARTVAPAAAAPAAAPVLTNRPAEIAEAFKAADAYRQARQAASAALTAAHDNLDHANFLEREAEKALDSARQTILNADANFARAKDTYLSVKAEGARIAELESAALAALSASNEADRKAIDALLRR